MYSKAGSTKLRRSSRRRDTDPARDCSKRACLRNAAHALVIRCSTSSVQSPLQVIMHPKTLKGSDRGTNRIVISGVSEGFESTSGQRFAILTLCVLKCSAVELQQHSERSTEKPALASSSFHFKVIAVNCLGDVPNSQKLSAKTRTGSRKVENANVLGPDVPELLPLIWLSLHAVALGPSTCFERVLRMVAPLLDRELH